VAFFLATFYNILQNTYMPVGEVEGLPRACCTSVPVVVRKLTEVLCISCWKIQIELKRDVRCRRLLFTWTLKKETAFSTESLAFTDKTTRRHKPEDKILHDVACT